LSNSVSPTPLFPTIATVKEKVSKSPFCSTIEEESSSEGLSTEDGCSAICSKADDYYDMTPQ